MAIINGQMNDESINLVLCIILSVCTHRTSKISVINKYDIYSAYNHVISLRVRNLGVAFIICDPTPIICQYDGSAYTTVLDSYAMDLRDIYCMESHNDHLSI